MLSCKRNGHWDLATGQQLVTHHGPRQAMDVAFSPDGKRLAVAGRPMVKILDVVTGEEVFLLRGVAQATPNTSGFNPRVCFSPDGKRIAAICHGSSETAVSIWSVADDTQAVRAARLRAAQQRALARHLYEARGYSRGYGDRESVRFHAACLEGLELPGPWDYLEPGKLHAMLGQEEPALADLARVAKSRIDGWFSALERGHVYAELGRWDEAAAAYAQAFEQGVPLDALAWRQQAALRLHLGDHAGYERVCAGILEREGWTTNWTVAVAFALGCTRGPQAVVEPARVLQWAQPALTRYPNDFWARHVVGTAHYRAGQFPVAIRTLETAAAAPHSVLDWLVLAMAHSQLGKADQAQLWLDRTERWLAERKRDLRREGILPAGWTWWEWLEFQALHREALVLIQGKAAKPREGTGGLVPQR
ncbi:MAG: hypothetical protein L0Z62_05720 [Gemmataceae bacterium]|nr:hypothetical protein [Gemmataceae bacterium]